jgi:hypothetical protein
MDALAPIEVKILLFFRQEKQKIGTDSGISSKKTIFAKQTALSLVSNNERKVRTP